MIFICNPADNTRVVLTERHENGILLLDVDVRYPEPTTPHVLTVSFSIDCTDIYSI